MMQRNYFKKGEVEALKKYLVHFFVCVFQVLLTKKT